MDHRKYAYPDDLLHDRIIMITGATAGIGRALAIHAAAHGAQVILHGRNVTKLEAVSDEIEAIAGAPRPSIATKDHLSVVPRVGVRYGVGPKKINEQRTRGENGWNRTLMD